ncbi:hypothetical protein PGTUg99_010008 [Puccinia graminis f. sp. tritici]|uniref:Uncharacterized protein n=1 Tax=Puccinia graminis f. sp. tritici TaxID=56615 RepID=A0A5B0RTY7_PUCGR|nr:hypothetical protein PGTUg99_010008 [Puccinia graminis f. sp. tritici]
MAACPDVQDVRAHQDIGSRQTASQSRRTGDPLVQVSESHSEETNMESLSARISNEK